MNIRDHLDANRIAYETIAHRPTFDAQRLAQAVAETGHHVAKTVLLKSERGYTLAVTPATHTIDLSMAARAAQVDCLRLATEEEIAEQFPDCETGAVPPFGSLYGIETLMDDTLSEAGDVVFEGNRHDEAIRMSLADFVELEKPRVMRMSH